MRDAMDNAIQSLIDQLSGKIVQLRSQKPEQFDQKNPKSGQVLQAQCITSVQGLLSDAQALQTKIKSHFDRFAVPAGKK